MIIIEWEKVSSDGCRHDAQLSSDWVAAAAHCAVAAKDSFASGNGKPCKVTLPATLNSQRYDLRKVTFPDL